MTLCDFPRHKSRKRRRSGSFLNPFAWPCWSSSFRAHNPALTDDELDDLWQLGEDTARGCTNFQKRPVPNAAESCVDCHQLGECTGQAQGIHPGLLRLVKEAFRHALIVGED